MPLANDQEHVFWFVLRQGSGRCDGGRPSSFRSDLGLHGRCSGENQCLFWWEGAKLATAANRLESAPYWWSFSSGFFPNRQPKPQVDHGRTFSEEILLSCCINHIYYDPYTPLAPALCRLNSGIAMDRPPATRGLCWQPVQGWEDDRCDLCRVPDGGQNKSERFQRQQMACPIACF